MTALYGSGSRDWQDRFDTRRLADRIEEALEREELDDGDVAFVTAADMFFLATVGADGQPQCSYKGGEPGFVRVLDRHTLAFPGYDGNGMFLSLGNVSDTGRVGLLFVDFTSGRRLRVNGVATVVDDDPLLAEWPEAKLVVRVRTTSVFPNCSRYVHRMALVERSRFTPRRDRSTPVPDWKRSAWARDVLAAGDPARSPAEP